MQGHQLALARMQPADRENNGLRFFLFNLPFDDCKIRTHRARRDEALAARFWKMREQQLLSIIGQRADTRRFLDQAPRQTPRERIAVKLQNLRSVKSQNEAVRAKCLRKL